MRVYLLFFVLLLCFLPSPSYSMKRSSMGLTRPCTILIQNQRNSGEKVRVAFTTRFKSKMECRQLANMHTKNFETDLVRKKRVHFVWNKRTPKLSAKKMNKISRKLSKVQLTTAKKRSTR